MRCKNILTGAVCLSLAGVAGFLLTGILLARTQEAPLHPIYEDNQQRPPNIVLILFDWGRRDALGVYSDKDVSTPNMDRLAERGVRFDNAYSPATLCSPARASIMTGLYPHVSYGNQLAGFQKQDKFGEKFFPGPALASIMGTITERIARFVGM